MQLESDNMFSVWSRPARYLQEKSSTVLLAVIIGGGDSGLVGLWTIDTVNAGKGGNGHCTVGTIWPVINVSPTSGCQTFDGVLP